MRLSVILTAYDRPEGLDRSLASLAGQTRQPEEVLVFANPSGKDLRAAAVRWQDRFRGFRFVEHGENIGPCANLNAAVQAARGEFIANLHDDDTFAPTLLQRWEDTLRRHPSAGFVFCRVGGRNCGAERALRGCAELTPGREFNRRYFLNSWRGSSPVWGTVMARRTAYQRCLPFNPAFGGIADVDMWMRLSWEFDVAFVDAPLIEAESPSRIVSEKGVDWFHHRALQQIHRANLRRFAPFSGAGRRFLLWGGHTAIFAFKAALMVQSELRHGHRRG